MKKSLLLLALLIAFFTSCQKFDPVVDENIDLENEVGDPNTGNVITKMSDLIISDQFDWSMIQTLDVQITLPEDDASRILYIYSQDGNRLYYKGHPEDGTNVLRTKVTVPTFESVLYLKYGVGENYPEIGTYLSGTNLYFNLNSSFKSSLKKGDDDPCTGCEAKMYSLTFKYNGSGTVNVGGYDGKEPKETPSFFNLGSFSNIGNGDTFTFYGTKKENTEMSSSISLYVNGFFYSEIHVSCSQPLYVGMIVGDFEITAGVDKNGGTLAPNPCDTDGDCDDDYNSQTFGGFLFEYDGMTENIDGTSTWTYTVTGVAPDGPEYKDLSHWVLALCNNHVVDATATTAGYEVNTDPTLGFYGIKWDNEINKNGGTMTFSFTLDEQYDVEPVTVGFKAGTNLHYCEIYGPSCESIPEPPSDSEVFGIVAFEDLWPSEGDYDLNDLVIEYDFAVTKDNNEYVESIVATFEIRCFGAGFHNGFGFTFPNVDPDDIVEVTGYDIQNTALFNIGANGTENGQTNATFILYDDSYRLMQHPGSGTGVNTEHPHPYVTPAVITLTIEFAENAVTYSQLDHGNFNPFIVVEQTRGREVHLPNYQPTDLADDSYFQTLSDDTSPPGKTYLTEDNLPWAILIPQTETFDYPIEFQSIIGAYTHFAEWAQSDGNLYPDWYANEPGYRNASVIY